VKKPTIADIEKAMDEHGDDGVEVTSAGDVRKKKPRMATIGEILCKHCGAVLEDNACPSCDEGKTVDNWTHEDWQRDAILAIQSQDLMGFQSAVQRREDRSPSCR